jgi:hypothetical protein
MNRRTSFKALLIATLIPVGILKELVNVEINEVIIRAVQYIGIASIPSDGTTESDPNFVFNIFPTHIISQRIQNDFKKAIGQ